MSHHRSRRPFGPRSLPALGLAVTMTLALVPAAQAHGGPPAGFLSVEAPASGMLAAEVDDGSRPGPFQAWLEANRRVAHEDLPGPGPGLARVVDASGRPLPFIEYRLTVEGREAGKGRTWLDGTIPLPAAGSGVAYRVELSGRGAARVAEVGAGARGADLALPGVRPLPSPLAVDLVFVLDTTVSMAPRLRAAKAALERTAALVGALPGVEARFGLVLYRDRGEDYLTTVTALGGAASLAAALSGVEAAGGGDIPEDLGAGLEAALGDIAWEAGSLRFVVALTDAPPKIGPGQGYARAVAAARAMGARLVTVGLGPLPLEGEYALRQIAAATGAPYLAADAGYSPSIRGTEVLVRSPLEAALARLVEAEAEVVRSGGGSPRDPALAVLDAVQARMAARLAYPEAARLRGVAGRVGLGLEVGPEGQLLSAKVLASSGSALLDRAALDLAATAFPTANPTGAGLDLEIAVTYRLRE